ncbi:hypothetical protein BC831DRAFT_446963 [Entophlyctis helioformis]|nr:hypothetical protein BC831DRAFT_446963 [Entophlyctis helioformis]
MGRSAKVARFGQSKSQRDQLKIVKNSRVEKSVAPDTTAGSTTKAASAKLTQVLKTPAVAAAATLALGKKKTGGQNGAVPPGRVESDRDGDVAMGAGGAGGAVKKTKPKYVTDTDYVKMMEGGKKRGLRKK